MFKSLCLKALILIEVKNRRKKKKVLCRIIVLYYCFLIVLVFNIVTLTLNQSLLPRIRLREKVSLIHGTQWSQQY